MDLTEEQLIIAQDRYNKRMRLKRNKNKSHIAIIPSVGTVSLDNGFKSYNNRNNSHSKKGRMMGEVL